MRWSRGESTVRRLIAENRLQQVRGAEADGSGWVVRAERTVAAANAVIDVDADSAFVLAYDAARQACVALLAHQGLRPTTEGGHYVIEEVIRAQFGDFSRAFGSLRRRRNELEYLVVAGDRSSAAEAAAALTEARKLIDTVTQILPNLGLFI